MRLREISLIVALGLTACAAAGGRSVARPMASEDTAATSAYGGGGGGGGAMVAADPADRSAMPLAATAEAIVVEGSLSVEVKEVAAAAAALRAEVEAGGGRVVDERLDGGVAAWRAELKLRVPPERVPAVVAWIGANGAILSKHLTATDVSRTLFDRDLAIANKRAAMVRLDDILARGGATMADVLAIEQEMTRLRGELEALEGEQRYLRDRVGQATLEVTLVRKDGEVHVAAAKLYPGVRFAALTLLDRAERPRTRVGVGLVVHTIFRAMSLEVDLYSAERATPEATEKSRAVIATLGGAGYSDFLGRGRRRFLNPYVGFRTGYGYLDRSLFVVQGELGLELLKHRHGVLDLGVRVTGLIGAESDVALVSGMGASLAF